MSFIYKVDTSRPISENGFFELFELSMGQPEYLPAVAARAVIGDLLKNGNIPDLQWQNLARDYFVECLSHEEWGMRSMAIHNLQRGGWHESPGIRALIRERLNDESDLVRFSAQNVLGEP